MSNQISKFAQITKEKMANALLYIDIRLPKASRIFYIHN